MQHDLTPGMILLYKPCAIFGWYWRRRQLPSLRACTEIATGLVIGFVCRQPHSHSVQYIGEDTFVHTRAGCIRGERACDFPPGYLETASLLRPRDPSLFSPQVRDAFQGAIGRKNLDPTTIPLAALFRLLFWLGIIRRKDWHASYRYTNCITFMLLTWKLAGVDLLQGKSMCYVGTYPSDFMEMTSEFEVIRE